MKSKSKLVYIIGSFIGILLIILIISQLSSALEPKLLWKKEIPSKIYQTSFARESGDVIFIHELKGVRNQITIFDRSGNTVWQFGPSFDETIVQVDISDEGNIFIYNTNKKTIHYCQRNGKEIWKLQESSVPHLSSDGKYLLLVAPPFWKGDGKFLDDKGKTLWQSEKLTVSEELVFSPDGNYFATIPNIFDIHGNTWSIPYGYYNSLTDNGEFVGIEGTHKDGIYDKDGTLVFDGKSVISGNGKSVATFSPRKTQVFKFPEKVKLREYPIEREDNIEKGYWAFGHTAYSRISYDGRYIAIFGQRTDEESLENVFILDVNDNKFWGEIIPEIGKKGYVGLFLTNNGKYLLVINIASYTKLYLYQVY